MKPLRGLIAATFSPMNADCSVDLERVPDIVEHLLNDGIAGLFVNGSTGEGLSLSTTERRNVAEAYVRAADGRLPVVVQVGHNSLAEAHDLARHAADIGADAIGASPPCYFKPASLDALIASLRQIVAGAPELPFYYYHLPGMTGVELDMLGLLEDGTIPSLTGIKFSHPDIHVFSACTKLENGRFNMLFGCDEMLLSGLVAGAAGAVGSTYNFAAPLYHQVIEAFDQGDLETARIWQDRAAAMVRAILMHQPQPGLKAMMKLIGLDCGPSRLPNQTLSDEATMALRSRLERIGFFDWRTT